MGFLEFFSKNYSPTSPIPSTMTLWTDSESVEACALQKEPKPASRHFILRELKVREFSENSPSRLRFCKTTFQRADALTKGCDIKQHRMVLERAEALLARAVMNIVALFDAGIQKPMWPALDENESKLAYRTRTQEYCNHTHPTMMGYTPQEHRAIVSQWKDVCLPPVNVRYCAISGNELPPSRHDSWENDVFNDPKSMIVQEIGGEGEQTEFRRGRRNFGGGVRRSGISPPNRDHCTSSTCKRRRRYYD